MLRPGGAVPIPHVHPIQTERFDVVEGRIRFRVGWRHWRLRATSSRSLAVASRGAQALDRAGGVGIVSGSLHGAAAEATAGDAATASDASTPGGDRDLSKMHVPATTSAPGSCVAFAAMLA